MPRRSGTPSLARHVGARIRALREEGDLTQERLAWECDLDKGYVSQIEAGKRLPSLPVLQALAKRLGVELADIAGFNLRSARVRLLDAARRGDGAAVRTALRKLGLDLD